MLLTRSTTGLREAKEADGTAHRGPPEAEGRNQRRDELARREGRMMGGKILTVIYTAWRMNACTRLSKGSTFLMDCVAGCVMKEKGHSQWGTTCQSV